MLFIASVLMEILAFLMLFAAGASGYFTYRTWTELMPSGGSGSFEQMLEVIKKSQQLQIGASATVSCTLLFLGFMVAFAVIDTARHTRKVLDQLKRMERV